VEFVDDIVLKINTGPSQIVPLVAGADDLGWTVYPLGLGPGYRIGILVAAIQTIAIQGAGVHSLDASLVVSLRVSLHEHEAVGRVQHVKLDFLS
jgi:hypothetical protein